jgi:hypothetical protein
MLTSAAATMRRLARPSVATAGAVRRFSSAQVIDTIAEFHDMRRQMPAGTAVGLVPTMGVRPAARSRPAHCQFLIFSSVDLCLGVLMA